MLGTAAGGCASALSICWRLCLRRTPCSTSTLDLRSALHTAPIRFCWKTESVKAENSVEEGLQSLLLLDRHRSPLAHTKSWPRTPTSFDRAKGKSTNVETATAVHWLPTKIMETGGLGAYQALIPNSIINLIASLSTSKLPPPQQKQTPHTRACQN